MPLFVWLKGLKGPEPQIWLQDMRSGDGKRKDENVLSEHKISDAEVLEGFNVLRKRYAAPVSSD